MGKSKFWSITLHWSTLVGGFFLASNQGRGLGGRNGGSGDTTQPCHEYFWHNHRPWVSREIHGLFWKYISGFCFCFKRAECRLLVATWLSILQGPERAVFFSLVFRFPWGFIGHTQQQL